MKCRCEGHGYVSIDKNERKKKYRAAWREAEEKCAAPDGWHIVPCLDCDGSGVVQLGFWARLRYAFTGRQ